MIQADHLNGRAYLHDIEHEIGALAAIAERHAGTVEGREAKRDLTEIYRLLKGRS